MTPTHAVAYSLLNKSADAVSSLEVSSGGGTVIDGALQVCPGTTVSLNCSHDSAGDLTRWEIGAPIECSTVATHSTNPSDALCGTFTINMVSASNQPTRMATLVFPVDQSLNGAVVVTCYAGATTSDPQVGNFTIHAIGEIHTRSTCDRRNGQYYIIIVYIFYLAICRSSFHSNC